MASQSSPPKPPPAGALLADIAAALPELPLFPLPQAVLFPGARLPLHVFEPRYRRMTRDVLDGHRCMAIVQIVEGAPSDPRGQPAIADFAGLGLVVESHELPDGRFHLLLEGRGRVRLEELPFVPPYRRARATLVDDIAGNIAAVEATSLLAVAHAFIAAVRSRSPEFDLTLPSGLPPVRVADLCAQHLVLDGKQRQSLLETLDPAERVRRVAEILAVQMASLRGQGGGIVN